MSNEYALQVMYRDDTDPDKYNAFDTHVQEQKDGDKHDILVLESYRESHPPVDAPNSYFFRSAYILLRVETQTGEVYNGIVSEHGHAKIYQEGRIKMEIVLPVHTKIYYGRARIRPYIKPQQADKPQTLRETLSVR